MSSEHEPATDRVQLRRGVHRGSHDPAVIREILAAGLAAHVGVSTEDGPLVLPMAYGITEDTIYVHGAAANALLRSARSQEVCITVTLLDALVFARTPFHNSMNYRCVVVRGSARVVDEPDERVMALRLISDHVVDNWSAGRPPSDIDIRKTLIIAVPLTEASAKIRNGGPVDEPDDLEGEHWGGYVPLITSWGTPIDSGDLRPGIAPPLTITAAFGG